MSKKVEYNFGGSVLHTCTMPHILCPTYVCVLCPTYLCTMPYILCPTFILVGQNLTNNHHNFFYCQILLTPTFSAIQYMHVVTHLHSQTQTHQCYTPVKKLCNEGNQTLLLAVKSSVVETEKDEAENEAWRINRIRYTAAHTYKNNRWEFSHILVQE